MTRRHELATRRRRLRPIHARLLPNGFVVLAVTMACIAAMLLQIARTPSGCLCIGPPRVDVARVFNGEPLRGSTFLYVTPNAIHAPGWQRIPLPSAGEGPIDELVEALGRYRARASANPEGYGFDHPNHVALEIDHNLPVWLVKRVVESCARADFWDIDFVGIQMPR